MSAVGTSCPSAVDIPVLLVSGSTVCLAFFVLILAWSYPSNPRRQFARLGKFLLAAVSPLLFVAGIVVGFASHLDRCGKISVAASEWANGLAVASIVVAAVGLALLTASEWAPMLLVAVLDTCQFGYACVGLYGRQGRAMALFYGTHAICVAVAAWWSWRARGRAAAARAKASEAGRLLVGGLAAVLLLQAASSGDAKTNPVLTTSSLGAVLIGTALAVALGTGFTKYVEAMETPLVGPQPRSRLRIRPLRRALTQNGQTPAGRRPDPRARS